ncbi:MULTISPECIES: SphA family protein [Bradyrhizobium]|uniref:Transporter n=2 Tax=Bradyrhizobium quebecense TaxID=2748629 RepID=A0ABS3MGB8_9BRAD|nr:MULTISPECIES: transporter [Bradyrhizobium]UFX46471.1 transporter [Bradyrhizobium sp. 41S5]UGY05713.1 transporter [Bradyrhizobium quebecense]
MRTGKIGIAVAGIMAATPVSAYEFGYSGYASLPGVTVGGATAGAPPPGVYMFNQVGVTVGSIVGPGAPNINGSATPVHVSGAATGLLWVPGWTFLGATYDAVVVQPWFAVDVGNPVDAHPVGFHNTYFVPAELSWKLGDSGFFVKTGFGFYAPNGNISGANGLGGIGNPWWTFQPEFIVSYLKDGWNFTANVSREFNTKNSITDYRTGDIMHAEFTATKTIERWTVGGVAFYVGQVTNDTSSAFYKGAINSNKYDVWAVGGLVGYDFGPANFTVWALDRVSAVTSGGTAGPPGVDTAAISKGYTVYAQLSFRLWAPEESAVPTHLPLIRK